MNNTKGLVSIIVISYNHSAFLKECLDSVLGQTYKKWELIVADDASQDNAQELISAWLAENNVEAKRNFHERNTGIGTVLNECIDLCVGEYIKFIAADDVLDTNLIEEAICVFEKGDENLGVVFTNAQHINEYSQKQDKTVIENGTLIPNGWIKEAIQFDNFIPAPAVVIKKRVFDKIGYFDPMIKTDDYDCWLRASRFFTFQYIDKPLVYYRVHSNNISHSLDFLTDRILLLLKNDCEGDFAKGLKKMIMDRYYLNDLKIQLARQYNHYQFRDKWLSFCINNKIPYRLFRVLDKLRSI